jgi:hypothetical protein
VKGLGLFVGKRSKTWYFQKDVGGRTKRILVGRWPAISARVARQTAMGYALEWGRGAGKRIAFEAPSLQEAMESYLARPRLRSEAHKLGLRQQFELHLGDWLHLPLDEITKAMVVQRHAALAKTPSTANHLLKYFRTVYNHARRTHDLPENPTMAIEWFEEKGSGAIIGDLAAWRRVMDALENPVHRAFYELSALHGVSEERGADLGMEACPRGPHPPAHDQERAQFRPADLAPSPRDPGADAGPAPPVGIPLAQGTGGTPRRTETVAVEPACPSPDLRDRRGGGGRSGRGGRASPEPHAALGHRAALREALARRVAAGDGNRMPRDRGAHRMTRTTIIGHTRSVLVPGNT